MYTVKRSVKMEEVHSDIRGPLYMEALEMEKNGCNVLKLNTGNPATFGFTMPRSVTTALTGREGDALGYCDFRGMGEARAAICAYHRRRGLEGITENDVFIGNGVSEVVTFALMALLNAGDEVLLPTPCYSLWSNTVRLCGGKCVFYCCDEASDFQPDIADMRKKVTSKTRAIVLINPNNPTGALYEKDVLAKIAALAREKHLLLFSDEIYDRLVLDGRSHTSIAAIAPDLPVVTMNGLSKSHFLCGFRVGWMVLSGPATALSEYKDALIALTSLRLCANALAQLVIPAALADDATPSREVAVGGRFYEQREAVCHVLDTVDGISYVKNRAAFYLFPRIELEKFSFPDDKAFARALLHDAHILLVPGSGFEYPEKDHFRIVMLPEKDILTDAMLRMKAFLDRSRK